MGRIDRLKTVTRARIEAFLASLEKPETVMPQLTKEMTDAVAEAARAEAKALTAVKADRRRVDAASGRVSRLGKGAKLALDAGEIDTARQAIAAQIQAEQEVEHCRRNLAVSESAYESARHVRRQFQNQLEDVKVRGQEVLARARTLRQQKRLDGLQVLKGRRVQSILDTIAGMETQVEEQEARLEIRDQIRQTLGATFQHERAIDLENDAEVDRRLEQLKNEAAGDTPYDPAQS